MPVNPYEPTQHPIGSDERLEVMRLRAELGMPLHMDGDTEDKDVEPHADKQSVKHVPPRHDIRSSADEHGREQQDQSEIGGIYGSL